MILACPKMSGISLNITNVCVQKSLKPTLPDCKNPESAIWRQTFHVTLYSIYISAVGCGPFYSAFKNFLPNDDRFAIMHSMQPMLHGMINTDSPWNTRFVCEEIRLHKARAQHEQSMSRARMQIQGQNTQIHKVRTNAASVSHWDEQESITMIIMNSKWSDFSFFRSHE